MKLDTPAAAEGAPEAVLPLDGGAAVVVAANGLADTSVQTAWPPMRPRHGCEITGVVLFDRWLATARTRDRMVYAVGQSLNWVQKEPVLAALRRACNLGLITFTTERVPTKHGRFETRFMAVRLSRPLPQINGGKA